MTDPITPLTPAQLTLAEQQTAGEGYLRKAAIGLDQFVNVLTGGLPDETISSRATRWDTEDRGLRHVAGREMSKFLDLFQKDHGAEAEAGDLERATIAEITEETTGTLPKQGS